MKRSRGRGGCAGGESLADFDRRVEAGATRLSGWRVAGVDLRDRGDVLGGLRVGGATFLGCTFGPGVEERIEGAGALVLPPLTIAPVDVYRSGLYTAEELYDVEPYLRSLDGRAYAWSQTRGNADDALARSLHDHSIDEALTTWIRRKHLVGVMGGHAAQRGDAEYAEAARLGHALGAHYVVATGGGPGAMEAANLGCYLAGSHVSRVTDAVAALAEVPAFRPSVDAWLRPALEVCSVVSEPHDSLGIPTWHYGHEPTNVFATGIAKYFRNATREATLLEVCDAGIVFLPEPAAPSRRSSRTAARTTTPTSRRSPRWSWSAGRTGPRPCPPGRCSHSMARGRPMEIRVHLVDHVDEAVDVLVQAASSR